MIDPVDGYKTALKLAGEHYENFPVVSLFVPRELRKDVAIIYWFARTADDIADEGDTHPEERLRLLDAFQLRFEETLKSKYIDSLDIALHSTIRQRNLDPQLFLDLVSAFRQDITVKRYNDFDDILDYCSRSANPVGRLILQLHGYYDRERRDFSDKICTSLQLINFYQDLKIDFLRERLYIPIKEILSFGLDESLMMETKRNDRLEELLKVQVDRSVTLMKEGLPLIDLLEGRLRVQIAATCEGGLTIAKKIVKSGYSSYLKRPRLSKYDYFNLFIKSIF